MADEITISGGLSFSKDGKKASLSGKDNKDMVGGDYVARTFSIGTSEETLDKGEIGTLGYVAFKNVGTSGTVRLGSSTGVYTISVTPGEFAGPLKWLGTNVLAIADVAAAELEVLFLEA